MVTLANAPKMSGLFPELETIYLDAVKEGGIAPGHLADSKLATQAIANAIDKTMCVGVPDSALGKLVKHLVNVTIPDLQRQLDDANASLRSKKLATRLQAIDKSALIPVRVVTTSHNSDTYFVVIEREDTGESICIKREKDSILSSFAYFNLWASPDQIDADDTTLTAMEAKNL